MLYTYLWNFSKGTHSSNCLQRNKFDGSIELQSSAQDGNGYATELLHLKIFHTVLKRNPDLKMDFPTITIKLYNTVVYIIDISHDQLRHKNSRRRTSSDRTNKKPQQQEREESEKREERKKRKRKEEREERREVREYFSSPLPFQQERVFTLSLLNFLSFFLSVCLTECSEPSSHQNPLSNIFQFLSSSFFNLFLMYTYKQ